MRKLLTLAIIVGAFAGSATLSGNHMGASSSCVNDKCLVAASSSVGSVIISLALFVYLFLRPTAPLRINANGVVGVWRRFWAFLIDYALVLFVVSPLAALAPLLIEAGHTGSFEWSFVRTFSRPSDSLVVVPAVFASFTALYLYFFLHPLKNWQTVGEYILGFKVVAASDIGPKPVYGTRPITSFIGLCVWPISVYFALQKEDKRFWWDTDSRTRVVRVEESPPG